MKILDQIIKKEKNSSSNESTAISNSEISELFKYKKYNNSNESESKSNKEPIPAK